MNIRTIKTKLHGKEEMFKVIALGEATGLPVLFVGPPGVAKTNVLLDYATNMYEGDKADVLKKTFIIELDEATKNTEIKGRPDMKELLENKRYLIDAPIAEAEYVLINEVDKGSSGVRNTLLSVMRERQLFLGHETRDCKWKLFAGSCNEITQDTADIPFWDRFLIKFKVERVAVSKLIDSWGGSGKEFRINVPTMEEVHACPFNPRKMESFAKYIHSKVTDRTLYHVPIVTKACKLIWECSDTEAIVKACEFICSEMAATVGSTIEDPAVTNLKNRIKQISGLKDVNHMASLLTDIQKDMMEMAKNPDYESDMKDMKNELKKVIKNSPIAKKLIEKQSDETENTSSEEAAGVSQSAVQSE